MVQDKDFCPIPIKKIAVSELPVSNNKFHFYTVAARRKNVTETMILQEHNMHEHIFILCTLEF